jgi:hypothetical protein
MGGSGSPLPPRPLLLPYTSVCMRGASTAARVSATKKRRRAAGGERDVRSDVAGGHDEGVTVDGDLRLRGGGGGGQWVVRRSQSSERRGFTYRDISGDWRCSPPGPAPDPRSRTRSARPAAPRRRWSIGAGRQYWSAFLNFFVFSFRDFTIPDT